MHIEDLYDRLVDVARQRIRSGELTERGLSRICGVSQPHMHNVLKNIRALSPGSASRLMDALGVTLPELVWKSRDDSGATVRAVPIVRNPIGPGVEAVLTVWRGFMPFSQSLVEALSYPVVAQVGPDLVLPRLVAANDFILLDQNPEARSRPCGERCWVVSDGSGLRIRYVRLSGTKLYLANETTVHDPRLQEAISLQNREITDIVRARIVWMGRQFESE